MTGSGQPNAAFERVVEAALLMSGLGFESGGLSIAHAMTRGLSRVAGPREAVHGWQVAYGLLLQLVLEKRDAAFMSDCCHSMTWSDCRSRLPISRPSTSRMMTYAGSLSRHSPRRWHATSSGS